MAQKITAPASPPKPRGRPPKAQPAAGLAPRAPAFGDNGPDESLFLRHVQEVVKATAEREAAKLVIKAARDALKAKRKLASDEGISLRELDEAIEAKNADRTDLAAREKRRIQYMNWLGLDIGAQSELDLTSTDHEREKKDWFARGNGDARIGRPREKPPGIPGERLQDYLQGWDAGQEAVMRSSPLTKAAFTAAVGGAPAAAKPAEPVQTLKEQIAEVVAEPASGGLLTLNETHFRIPEGGGIDDANLKTLTGDGLSEAFAAADSVVVVFGNKRRILKEQLEDGTVYIDDGEDAPLSEVEELPVQVDELA